MSDNLINRLALSNRDIHNEKQKMWKTNDRGRRCSCMFVKFKKRLIILTKLVINILKT